MHISKLYRTVIILQRKQSKPKKHDSVDESFDDEEDVSREFHTKLSNIKTENNSSIINDASNSYEGNDDFLEHNHDLEGTHNRTYNDIEDKGEKKVKSKAKRKKRTKKKRESGDQEVGKRKRCEQERRLECDYCPEVCTLKLSNHPQRLKPHPLRPKLATYHLEILDKGDFAFLAVVCFTG